MVTRAQVDAARLEALEAQMRAHTLRLQYVEQQQRLTAEIQEAEQGERLELTDRLTDVEQAVFTPAPPEQAVFTPVPTEQVYRVPTGGTLHAEPDVEATIVAQLDDGALVRAVEIISPFALQPIWREVRTEAGVQGWILTSLIEPA
jgi:uncharacterized protein YndB with AHSA1/START domain